LGLDDNQGLGSTGPNGPQRNPQQAVSSVKVGLLDLAIQHQQLMAERQILQQEVATLQEGASKGAVHRQNHARHDGFSLIAGATASTTSYRMEFSLTTPLLKASAECANCARADLCGGAGRETPVPYRDPTTVR